MAEIVVSTFEEFLTACATSSAEVICPEGAVWDMNQIAPAGAPTVTVACAKIIGNGTTIVNASVISRLLFNFTNGATVTQLHVADFTADTSIIGGTTGVIWKQSEFNGVQNSGAMVSAKDLIFCEDETATPPFGCGFKVHLAGGCFFSYNSGGGITLRNCKASFTGGGQLDPKAGSRNNYLSLRYCFLEGDFTQISLNSYCGMSIINSPAKRGVYAGAGAQWVPWVDCTEEQLQDAEYLTSIGFTCGRR